MRDLVALGGEPRDVRSRENGVEQHQPLDGAGRAHGLPEPAVRLADRLVQRPVVDVVDPRSLVSAVERRRELVVPSDGAKKSRAVCP